MKDRSLGTVTIKPTIKIHQVLMFVALDVSMIAMAMAIAIALAAVLPVMLLYLSPIFGLFLVAHWHQAKPFMIRQQLIVTDKDIILRDDKRLIVNVPWR